MTEEINQSTKQLVDTEPTEFTKPSEEFSHDNIDGEASNIQSSPTVIEPESATVVVVDDKSRNNSIQNSSKEPIADIKNIQIENTSGFGKDFNWEMFQENHKLKEENQQIVEKLKKKEEEICNLEEALTTLHDELKFLETQEVQSVAKDLAKKNRKLSVQLERERSRCAQIQIDSNKLKSELAAFSHHNLSPKKMVEPMSFSERKNTKDTNDTNQANNRNDTNKLKQKLIRSKTEIVKYKDIIKKLNIALKKEIGDDTFDINDIIRDGGSWKGRAERIAILQSKLNQTKQKISHRNKNEEYKHTLSQTANQRTKQYESAQLQIQKLQQINEEQRQVLKAKHCRIKGIETNAISMRSKLNFFVEKSKTDDSLIETLQSQLNQQLKLQNSLNKKQILLNKNNNEISNLTITINQQNTKIKVLNKTIHQMKDNIIHLTLQRTDKLKAMFEKLDNDDKLYQIQILNKENDKQKEIISTYKKNLSNLQKRLSRKSSPREQVLMQTNRSNKNSKVLQLKERMEAMTQEQQLVKASYLSIIQGKQNEIEICRKMIEEQRDIHKNAFQDINQQIDQIKEEIMNA